MTKAERLEYMKKHWKEQEVSRSADAIIHPTKLDIREEIDNMESFEEYKRDKQTNSETLTSDEM